MKKREAYPLDWPTQQARTSNYRRTHSRFRMTSFALTRDELIKEVRRVDHVDPNSIILTTNIPLRGDGLPYANMRAPEDPGVAVYFTRVRWGSSRDMKLTYTYYAVACDQYKKIEENMRAIVHTIAAMRTIQRHGGGQMLEQAMSGFAALPPGEGPSSWWGDLGFSRRPSLDAAEERYRELVKIEHPDRGGSDDKMRRYNLAIGVARLEMR